MRLFFFSLFFFRALVSSADISCSSSYVSSLSSCDWSLPCTSQSYCFHGEYGVWGNVYRCNPGGYYDTREEFSYVCTSWSDDIGSPGIGVPGSGSPSIDFSSVEVLTYTLIAVCFLFSFLAGFTVGGRF
jgi:hypothetical protein